MSDVFEIAIIGSGPAGLSAAARAAEYDLKAKAENSSHQPTHVVLEAFNCHAKTIYDYQKSKFVMDEPGYLDLRSPLDFTATHREDVLESWGIAIAKLDINIRYGAEVTDITKAGELFTIQLGDGSSVQSRFVVLGIGMQGNPRMIGVENDDCDMVQYTLADPNAFKDEHVVVIGAGDAAAENALALLKANRVTLVNRRDEFSRVKDDNRSALLDAVQNQSNPLTIKYNASTRAIHPATDDQPGRIVLSLPDGDETFPCDRIIARLGAVPPRKFLQSIGIAFPNANETAVPELSEHYESNIPGLYIVGALAGYPLIKQALNQGHDVIEYIRGNAIVPVDTSLLERQFSLLPFALEVNQVVDMLKDRVPMFRAMSMLALRELLIESNIIVALADDAHDEAAEGIRQIRVHLEDRYQRGEIRKIPKLPTLVRTGDVVYRSGEFTNSFFTIVDGAVVVSYPDTEQIDDPLEAGDFFGEKSLLSGRPRAETVIVSEECILVETPRRVMVKLMNSSDEVKRGIEWVATGRILSETIAPKLTRKDLDGIVANISIAAFEAGETLYREGDTGDCFYFIRRGSVSLHKQIHGTEQMINQIQSGGTVGLLAVMGDPVRRETAESSVRVEAMVVNKRDFLRLIAMDGSQIERLQTIATNAMQEKARLESQPEMGQTLAFLMAQGIGEATNAFLFDETLCVGCNNCEVACAETHNGISRLNREAGTSFDHLHVSVACRHCEVPHCMKDCPPDAILRAANGEVFINDSCIGCGNCVSNCPYDAIQLQYPASPPTPLWRKIFFGPGADAKESEHSQQSGSQESTSQKPAAQKKAFKCDACKDLDGGPACVRACPTGAAFRIGAEQCLTLISERG